MAFHHVAIAISDLARSHGFYESAMGFQLVHAQAGVTDAPEPGGWAKHVFYDTGDGSLLALWDLHDPRVNRTDLSLSRGMGLPTWVNHIAFDAGDLESLEQCQARWLAHGHDVLRIDHGPAVSIYTEDPDGNMVEWTAQRRAFDDDRERALAIVEAASPALDPQPSDIRFFRADEMRGASPHGRD